MLLGPSDVHGWGAFLGPGSRHEQNDASVERMQHGASRFDLISEYTGMS